MKKIKIVQVPPGFAPEDIREQWVGVEIPVVINSSIPEENITTRIGTQNKDGYQVSGMDAVRALLEAGKVEAASFWEPYSTGNFVFKKEVCELIS